MKLKSLLLLAGVITGFSPAKAQVGTVDNSEPKDYLTPAFHAARRQAFRDQMPDNSVAVIFAYPERVFSNDVNYVYHPNPDLYYLTGYKEPNAVLLIYKNTQTKGDTTYNEVLFVQKRDAAREQWTGKRLGVDGARNRLGLKQVYTGSEFSSFPVDFSKFGTVLYDAMPDVSTTRAAKGSLPDLVALFKTRTNMTEPNRDAMTGFSKIRTALRGVKTPEELVLLKKAVEISAIAHAEVMRAIKPGMSERELEGILRYVHNKYGAEEEGYPPIVGAGANACILHYEENNVTKLDNQLVLLDVGAAYHGYSADVTRTIPANGKFTEEQKAIYQLVYEAQEAAFKLCKKGIPARQLETAASEVMANGLLKLGIIKTAAELRKYYPHGLSHHIGLDVHDKGARGDLEENMVITIEPGLYIPAGSDCDKKWWNIGVRIEDDVLIGKTEGTVLSAYAPRKWEDVEKMIAEKSIFDAVKLPDLK